MQIERMELLEKALVGYSHQKQQVEEKIALIRAELGGHKPILRKEIPALLEKYAQAAQPPKKRTMSVSARKRIAAAQKKRWADYHKAKAAAA